MDGACQAYSRAEASAAMAAMAVAEVAEDSEKAVTKKPGPVRTGSMANLFHESTKPWRTE
jgi:hypothetical protein